MFNNVAINSAATIVVSTGTTFIHTVDVLATLTSTVTFQSAAGVTYFVLPANTVAKSYNFDSTVGNGLTMATANAADYGLVLANVSQ